jgi:hypothetical protein
VGVLCWLLLWYLCLILCSRWEFNDNQVTRYEPTRIPHDCFGGFRERVEKNKRLLFHF